MKSILVSALALTASLAFGADAPKVLSELFTPGSVVRGEIVLVVPPPELDKYVAKVEEAAHKDPEWFREHSKNAKPGVPLPYHEKLGLTKEEYDEYLKLWAKREFKPVEPVGLQLRSGSDDKWSIAVSGSAQSISMLRYDPKEDVFRSPNGTLKRLEEVNADANSTLGAWTGHEWKFEESTSLGITKENIAIGQTADKKYGLVVYRLQEVSSLGTKLLDRGMVVRFPLGAAGIVKPTGKPADKPAGTTTDKPKPPTPAPTKPKRK